jgi:hypothetical protein
MGNPQYAVEQIIVLLLTLLAGIGLLNRTTTQ